MAPSGQKIQQKRQKVHLPFRAGLAVLQLPILVGMVPAFDTGPGIDFSFFIFY
jgi:hypothetical protein